LAGGAQPGSGPQYEAREAVALKANKISAIPNEMDVILTTIPLLLSKKANKIHGFCSFTKRFYHL
jgi:hypothetical protein